MERRDNWSPVVVASRQNRLRSMACVTDVCQEDNSGDKHEHEGTFGSSGYQELRDLPQSSDEKFDFMAKEFRILRTVLRFMSLWHPPEAGVFERYIYPVIVNLILLLLGLARNIIRSIVEASWLSIESMFIVHEIGTWFGHILGNYYFRSGDLSHVLPREPLLGVTKPLRRKMKFLNGFVLASFVGFTIMLVTTFVVWHLEWNSGAERFTANLPHVHGTLDHVLYVLVSFSIVYNLGIGLALSWTMGLLYICYTCRLKSLEMTFLKWRDSTNDAIYYFQLVYARPVKTSWKRISWWFLAHNLVAVAIPLFGYKLAQDFCSSAHQSKHLPQFACYLLFVLTIWLAPIIVAEQVKRREKAFSEHVNNFCLGLLHQQSQDCRSLAPLLVNDQLSASVDSAHEWSHGDMSPDADQVGSHGDTAACEGYTFAHRGKKLRDFLRFLKRRNQGLVARGYSLQLHLSIVSIFVGVVSFLLELNNESPRYGAFPITSVNNTLH